MRTSRCADAGVDLQLALGHGHLDLREVGGAGHRHEEPLALALHLPGAGGAADPLGHELAMGLLD